MTNRWKKTGNALENFAKKKSPAEAGQEVNLHYQSQGGQYSKVLQ